MTTVDDVFLATLRVERDWWDRGICGRRCARRRLAAMVRRAGIEGPLSFVVAPRAREDQAGPGTIVEVRCLAGPAGAEYARRARRLAPGRRAGM